MTITEEICCADVVFYFLTIVSTLSFAQYLLHIPEKFLTENTITHNLHTQQEKDQNPETKTTSTPHIRKKRERENKYHQFADGHLVSV